MTEFDLHNTDSMTYPKEAQHEPSKCERLMLKIFPSGFKVEFIEVFKLAWPAVFTSFFQSFLQTISIIMCGHLEKAQLDAAGLANSMINVFGISVGMGMSTACDTFFSQTFGGEEKWRVGIYLQRSVIIMNCMAILICCVHINIQPILLLLGQDEEIARLTADYMLCFFPGVFFDFNFVIMTRYLQNQNIVYPSLVCAAIGNVVNIVSQYVCVQVLGLSYLLTADYMLCFFPGVFFDFNFVIMTRYLQNQNIVYPSLVCAAIGNVVNIVSQYVCVQVLGLSYLSSAICQASSLGVMMVTLLIYILVSKVYETTWNGFTANEALRGWGMFFALAIPGLLLVGMGEWSFEIATFVAGTIDEVQLGIQTIMFQIEAILYMLPLGASIAINVRVGQHLGASNIENAITAYRVGVALILVTATISAILLVSLRNYIPLIFTNDEAIAEGISSIIPLIAAFLYGDGIAGTCSGALRGCGRQLTGAIINFFGYYVIALPIGISLAVTTDLKVFGMWCGLLVGMIIEAIIFFIAVCRTNWEQCSERAAMVAYGGDGVKTDNATDKQAVTESLTDNCTTSRGSEKDPLLKSRKKKRTLSTSFSRRAVLSANHEYDIKEPQVSSEPFRRVLIKRAIFAVFTVAWVTTAIFLRVFQDEIFHLVDNSTMPEYNSSIPL